jgi:mRNA-degrading endonuclease toxin of MazEF toxin-antitoxin module
LKAGLGGLVHDSWVKCDQVTTIEISTSVYPSLGSVDRETMKRIEGAIRVAVELPEKT